MHIWNGIDKCCVAIIFPTQKSRQFSFLSAQIDTHFTSHWFLYEIKWQSFEECVTQNGMSSALASASFIYGSEWFSLFLRSTFFCLLFRLCMWHIPILSTWHANGVSCQFFFSFLFFFFWLYSVIAQIGNILIQIWTKEIVYAIDIMRYFGITRLKWKVNLIDALLPILFLNIFGENVLWVSFDSFVALKTAYFQRWQATLQNLNCS